MRVVLGAALLLLGLGTFLQGQEHTSRESWVTFNSESGRFTAQFPQTPTDTVQTTESEHGPYTTHLYVARSTKSVFLIGWVDYDPSFQFNAQMELDANRDNFIKGLTATLLKSKNVSIDGYQSLEFTAETPSTFYTSRVFIVGKRPYQLVVGTEKGMDDSDSATRFFESFKVRSR